MQATPTLQLEYQFKSKPDLILASADGANPGSIELDVMISTRSLNATVVREITIQIPVGEDTSRAISSAPSLPAPVYDTSGAWRIADTGGTITVTPAPGGNGTVTSPILFSLPNIQVNETPGTVPITITEFPRQGPKVVDTTTNSLTKWPSDLAVTSFRAEPSALYDLGQYVTLYWDCTQNGRSQNYGYGLQADVSRSENSQATSDASPAASTGIMAGSLSLHDCVNDSLCYSCDDGKTGVRYGPIDQTTKFSLNVVATRGVGDRSIVATISTTVPLLLPSISPYSSIQPSVSGRLVTLRWLADNAAYCSIKQDDKVIVEKAPADTYDTGYLVQLPSASGQHAFEIVAHPLGGSLRPSRLFPTVTVGAPVEIPWDAPPDHIAVTPDGSLALVRATGRAGRGLIVLDLQAKQRLPNLIPTQNALNGWDRTVAFSPDSTLAYVSQNLLQNVAVVDLTTKTIDSAAIPVRDPWSVACSRDGSLLLVGNGFPQGIVVVHLPSRQVEEANILLTHEPGQIAMTSDGMLALVGQVDAQGDYISVIDIPARQTEATTLNVGPGPHDIAITSDDALALVVSADRTLRVVDIGARTVEAQPIPTGGRVCEWTLATTPDPRWAFVGLQGTQELRIIDVVARTSAPFEPLPGAHTFACAFSPTGSALVVQSDWRGGEIILI